MLASVVRSSALKCSNLLGIFATYLRLRCCISDLNPSLVYYLIYDVADFLLNGEAAPAKEISEEVPAAPTPIPKKKLAKSTAPVQYLSHIFMLRAFAQSLEEWATAMLSFAENLTNYANKKEMMENFAEKFPPKGGNQSGV